MPRREGTGWNAAASWSLGRPEAAPLAFLVVVGILLAATTPGFATVANFRAVMGQVAVVGLVAQAGNQVILSGEIDVSVGSLLAGCSYVFGHVAIAQTGLALPLLAGIATGTLVGCVNGLLVTVGRVPSIITTLGMLLLLRGLVLVSSANGVLIAPRYARFFGLSDIGGVGLPALTLVTACILFGVLGRHSTWGRNVLAVGGNTRAARATGLPVGLVRFWAFVASGVACGFASAIFIGQTGELQATAATGLELNVIAAVVLGGTSIAGGRGSVVAPLIGAVLLGFILDALALNGVPGIYEQLVTGGLILLAICTDAVRRRAEVA